MKHALLIFALLLLLPLLLTACGDDDDDNDDSASPDDDDDDATPDDDDDDDDATPDDDDDTVDDDTGDDDTVPEDIVDPPAAMPFYIEREQEGTAPTTGEVAAFTQTMKSFYEGVDFYRWAAKHSFGVPEDNPDGDPPYMIWWTNSKAVKTGDLVTFTFETPPDNTTAKSTRLLPAAIGLFLSTGDADAREVALGYMRGLSATYDGMIWADEDPVIDYLMARTIFYRSYAYETADGEQAYADYEPVRFEEEARRHDTWHNPENPTWGDIYVRNKRSKDDFPYLFRDVQFLARLIRESDDAEMVEAAIKLYRQIVRMCRDIVDKGYKIYTKGENGEVFLPRTEYGFVDDFASYTNYDLIFPNAECNPKIAASYIAYGNDQGNDCQDGDGGLYELIAMLSHYWSTNMIWGYHVSAVSMALTFGDNATARELLEGLAARMDKLEDHPMAGNYVEWFPDVSALLVIAAANGLPLTNREAQLIIEHFTEAVEYLEDFEYWDLWSLPDGEYVYIPDRYVYDEKGDPTDYFVRITEITHMYEYCYSPLKDPASAQFIDCDALLAGR
ncbi:MAG TPA: hypothetical protein PKW95_15265 [bacterium]|nr:hypothetical protein [bacterium]